MGFGRCLLFCVLAATGFASPPAGAQPLSTEIRYQGELRSPDGLVAGPVDVRARLYASQTGTDALASVTQVGVPAENGRLNVGLDFGLQAFSADEQRWLEIAVRVPAWDGVGPEPAFVTLTPRQAVTPAPFALFALAGNEGPPGERGPEGPTGPRGPEGPPGAPGASSWAELNGIPSGFVDGIDHDTTYVPGPGLLLSGSHFALDFSAIDARYVAPSAAVGGDLGGSLLSPQVVALRGHPVSPLSPQDGQVLAWSDASGWTPRTLSDPPESRRLTIHSRTFQIYENLRLASFAGYGFGLRSAADATGGGVATHPIDLPPGARITALRAHMYDSDAGSGQEVWVGIFRQQFGSSAFGSEIASVRSQNSDGHIGVDTTISAPLVDGNYAYQIGAQFSRPSDNGVLMLYAVQIDYEMPH